jgi:hypothetical protein
MRSPLAILLLTALAVLAGLRLAAAVQDTEAMRCAIACGHAASAMKGASCCPMAAAPGAGPSLKTCSRSDGLALIPLALGQPALLAMASRLTLPTAHRFLDPAPDARPRSSTPLPPDHVPLLFG